MSERSEDSRQEPAEKNQNDKVVFRVRKRPRKARSKQVETVVNSSNDDSVKEDETEEVSRVDLLLIKEAQTLRGKSRKQALDIGVSRENQTRSNDASKGAPSNIDNVVDLQGKFAVEKAGHVVEMRMSRFIEDGMQKKFGKKSHEDLDKEADGAHQGDLFTIPDRLQVKERPQYDPGEGLPVSGVEEVEIPEHVRRKNEVDTIHAHKALLTVKAPHRSRDNLLSTPGNVSSNYIKHRNDWMDTHLGPKAGGHDANEEGARNSLTKEPLKCDGDVHGNTSERGKGRRRQPMATDSVIADRFRKRWRR